MQSPFLQNGWRTCVSNKFTETNDVEVEDMIFEDDNNSLEGLGVGRVGLNRRISIASFLKANGTDVPEEVREENLAQDMERYLDMNSNDDRYIFTVQRSQNCSSVSINTLRVSNTKNLSARRRQI